MNLDNISVNTQSSIKMVFDKTIYFEPFKIDSSMNDADIIFITHEHYDHFDIDSINKVKSSNTTIIAPKSMENDIKNIEFKNYIFLNPNEEINFGDINIMTIPAYNIDKKFHPKNSNWLGYIITYNNVTYYIAGDTDKTPDNEKVKCDVAFIPIGGTYTMDALEAASLVKEINPKVVIPIHYGSIVGTKEDASKFKELLKNTNIEVVEKLLF